MLATTNSVLTRHFQWNAGRYFLQRLVFTFIFLAGAIALINLPVAAQGPTNGGFIGAVRDSAGRAIPGATITFKNQTNGFEVSSTSDQNGNYVRNTLPPGKYEITVEAQGFQAKTTMKELYATKQNEVLPPIILDEVVINPVPTPMPSPDENAQVKPTPIPSPIEEEPSRENVRGSYIDENITLNTRRDGAFNDFAVRTLPLGATTLTRTFDELAFLVPGVAPPPQAIGNTVGPGIGGGVGTSGQFSVNGLRSRANNFTVDGSDNNDEDIGVRRQGFFTLVPQPVESIQEFQIITLLAPAEFGRNLGAQVNVNSKGGGNKFHGSIFGLGNADFLNARNFFDNVGGDRTFPLQARQILNNGSQRLVDVCLDHPAYFDFKIPFESPCPEANKIRAMNDAGERDTFSLLQGGFAIGGPIVRDKLFFFASGEGQHMDGVRERHFAVPTVEQRGFFGSGATGFFNPGNRPNLVSPIYATSVDADDIFSLFPFPNDPNGVYGPNTYTKALSVDAQGIILSGKLDWNIFKINGNQQVLTSRYNFTDDKRDLTDVGGALFSAIRPLVRTNNFSSYLIGGLTESVSNELRFSWGQTRLDFEELRDDFLLPVERNFNNPRDARFLLNARSIGNFTLSSCPDSQPSCRSQDVRLANRVDYLNFNLTTEMTRVALIGQLIIAGFSPVGVDVFNFPQERTNDTFQFADTLRSQFNAKGQHSFAFGTDIRRVYLASDLQRNSRPLVTFNGSISASSRQNIPDIFTPLDFAAASAASGFFQTLVLPGNNSEIDLSYYQFNFFAQDEWRITEKLNINYGLRYEYNTTPAEANSKIENTFSAPLPNNLNFLTGLRNFIDERTKIYDVDKNNFAPRIGIAYSPTEKTVIRGGFGVYHDQILGAVVSQSRNVLPTFLTTNLGGVIPGSGGLLGFYNPLNTPYFGIPIVQDGTLNTLNPAVNMIDPSIGLPFLQALNRDFPSINNANGTVFGATLPKRQLEIPMSHQYFIGVEQRLFNNMFLSAAYVGTTGRDLLRFTTPNLGSNFLISVDSIDANSLVPFVFGTSSAPAAPGTNNRPTPGIGPIEQFETTGRSRYDSLQIELRGRLAQYFQYRANYVYGKVKDDVSDVFALAGAFALPQNSLTFEGEYAPANFDVRHRFTYSFVYSLPSFKDQNNFVQFLLGDWQIAGTGKFNTGQPFTVNSIFDVNQDGNLTDRLDNTQFITINDDRSQPLSRTCANVTECRRALALVGQNGSVPRNSFRAGSILELDMSFAKRFTVKDEQNMEVRFDVFNFINRTNFGIPVRIFEFPSFGRATETVTPGRRIQIMLRYNF